MKHADRRFHLTSLSSSRRYGAVAAILLPSFMGWSPAQAADGEHPAVTFASNSSAAEPQSVASSAPQSSAQLSAVGHAETGAVLPQPLKWSSNDPLYLSNKAAYHKDEGDLRLLETTPRVTGAKLTLPVDFSIPVLSNLALSNPLEPTSSPFIIAPVVYEGSAIVPQIQEIQLETPPVAPTVAEQPTPDAVPDGPPVSDAEVQARLDDLERRLNTVGETDLDPISLVIPSISSNIPNAYGATRGVAAFGFGYQNQLRYNKHRDDGTASGVIGLSDPRKLGVDVQFSILDLSRPGHNPAVGFKLHRQLANDYTVAIGKENAIVHEDRTDSDSSYYAVISKKLRLHESSSEPFSRVYLSFGLGNGRFLSENDVFNNKGGINVFGSAALTINPSTTAFAEWTGQSLNIGTSFIPLRRYPFVLTLALADIAGGGGDGSRFTAGFGYVLAK